MVSDYWVDHGEIDLLIVPSGQLTDRARLVVLIARTVAGGAVRAEIQFSVCRSAAAGAIGRSSKVIVDLRPEYACLTFLF